MQKIDFIKNIEIVVEKLKSREILDLFSTEKNKSIGDAIKPLLFASKSGYDQLKNNHDRFQILLELEFEQLYKDDTIAYISSLFDRNDIGTFLNTGIGFSFYTCHYALLQAYSLSKNILQNDAITEGLYENTDNGTIVFQVIIEEEGLSATKYVKIFTLLNELFTTIGKLFNETEEPEIILLDSGSDTNIGVKSGVETAKSLFIFIKEVWEALAHRKAKKQIHDNSAFRDNLSLLTEINQKVEEGTISPEEGKTYSHIIKTRMDELLGLKVIPKKLINENNPIDTTRLIDLINTNKQLKSGD